MTKLSIWRQKILAPHGLFRQGASRTWLDDNGYFIIFVVFEASDWSKGSRLGVGGDFLWKKTEGLNDILAYSYGGRVKELCGYDGNDDGFQIEIERYAEIALEKVMEYRKFKDMGHAKECLTQKLLNTPKKLCFWEMYDLTMLCFLTGDFEEGANTFEGYLNQLKKGFYVDGVYIEWKENFYRYCLENIKPCLTSKDAAQKMVLDMIERRRSFFNSKPSFKKMNKEILLG